MATGKASRELEPKSGLETWGRGDGPSEMATPSSSMNTGHPALHYPHYRKVLWGPGERFDLSY